MMEWNVKNAVNRDVERQHLNKILKEIRGAIDSVKGGTVTQDQITSVVTTIIQGGGSSTPTPASVTVTLQGDVTGTGSGNNVVIDTTVNPDILGIPDAPLDSNTYWRTGGMWQPVPGTLTSLALVDGVGYLHYDDNVGWTVVGPDALGADIGTVSLEAASTIHGRRAVCADGGTVYHPNLSTPSDSIKIVGISTQAASTGSNVPVQVSGRMTNPTWSWAAGPVYSDDAGVLTQTAPSTGWVVQVGRALTSTTIEIDVLITLLRS